MSGAIDFAGLHKDAATHLRLALMGIVAHLLNRFAEADEELCANFPFLREYQEELVQVADCQDIDHTSWHRALTEWVGDTRDLPLVRLREAGLGSLAIDLLLTLGLIEEDPRFAALIDPGRSRPTLGALIALWRKHGGEDRAEHVRLAMLGLADAGLARVLDNRVSRLDWEFVVPPPIWDALGGGAPVLEGLRFAPVGNLPTLASFIASEELRARVQALPKLIAREDSIVLCIRGPSNNGRRTLVGCIANALGRPLLASAQSVLQDREKWRMAGTLARICGAVLSVELVLSPGETAELPSLPLAPVPLMLTAGRTGGIRTSDGRPQTTIILPAPDVEVRSRHWHKADPSQSTGGVRQLASAFQLTSGNIYRAARAALAHAALEGRAVVETADVRAAARSLYDARLETVAAPVECGEATEFLVLDEFAHTELNALAARCRHRETLARYSGPAAGAVGVRALFAGPSGTGKTLAARRLAQDLGKDIWRIDLAAAVSKYIGETEKSLDRAFSAAEELDAILLLDEGDALMARRTDVGSANDRYANLETNFLLQRIESFGGILLVTTNAPDRIDKAFARRMDVVVNFRAPDELCRYEILDRHLGEHRASDELVQEIAVRCSLSGGLLRNIALHARLLALDRGVPIGDAELRSALVREYRKIDAHCPLKPALAAVG